MAQRRSLTNPDISGGAYIPPIPTIDVSDVAVRRDNTKPPPFRDRAKTDFVATSGFWPLRGGGRGYARSAKYAFCILFAYFFVTDGR